MDETGKKLVIMAYVARRYVVDATPEIIKEIRTNPTGMSLYDIVGNEDDTFLDYAELKNEDEDTGDVEPGDAIEVLYDSRKETNEHREAGDKRAAETSMAMYTAIREIAALTTIDEPLEFGNALADIQGICARALKGKPAPVSPALSAEDWQEIYAALQYAREGVETHKYGPFTDMQGQRSEKRNCVVSIMSTIGPDGCNMTGAHEQTAFDRATEIPVGDEQEA